MRWAFRNVAADTEFGTTNADVMNIQAAVYSLLLYSCLLTGNKPLTQTCKYSKLKAQWGSLCHHLYKNSLTVWYWSCVIIKCTEFKWYLPCESDSYPLKTIRFTQVFSVLHYLSHFWWCSHFLAAYCTCYYRVGRGTAQVAEWEKLTSSISQLVVL